PLLILFLARNRAAGGNTWAETNRGIAQGGAKPLLRGEPQQGPCQRFWLARHVLRRGGNFPRAGFPLGGNGKGGSDSLLPQAVRCCADCMHAAAFLYALRPIFSTDLLISNCTFECV